MWNKTDKLILVSMITVWGGITYYRSGHPEDKVSLAVLAASLLIIGIISLVRMRFVAIPRVMVGKHSIVQSILMIAISIWILIKNFF